MRERGLDMYRTPQINLNSGKRRTRPENHCLVDKYSCTLPVDKVTTLGLLKHGPSKKGKKECNLLEGTPSRP